MTGAPRTASACLDIPCTQTVTRAGPANLGVLVYADRRAPTPSLLLRDATGKFVETTIAPEGHVPGVFLVRPATPMTPGTRYVATYDGCEGSKDESLTVSAISALPGVVGTLQVSQPKIAPGPTGCVTAPETVLNAEVQLSVDPSFSKYLAVTPIEWMIDGAPFRSPIPGPTAGLDKSTLKLEADCTGENPSFLTPKVHEVELRAWVPGSGAPLTARATVDLRCAAPAAEDDRGSFGCAVTPACGASVWWLGLLPFAAVVARCRRRASTPHPRHGLVRRHSRP